ncbi:MAG TPA: hypothetical protein VMS79_04020 [Methanomassiliicoccales archaeon]|nr:hypothetical protein [Methanomassiliicoccales archaeon]
MLNLRRMNVFRYDVRAVLADSKVDQALASTVIANIIAKASKVGINDAKDYVREVESRGAYGKEVSQELCLLLDKYTLYR